MTDKRYLIADPDMDGGQAWEHFIGTDNGDKLMPTRFIYDFEENGGEIIRADAYYERAWHKLTWEDIEDLEDSVVNANGAPDEPAEFGLVASDELPEWYEEPVSTPTP